MRQVTRHFLKKNGLLARKVANHSRVAVRISLSVGHRTDAYGNVFRFETFERHYLHATKGWKVDKQSRKRLEKPANPKDACMFTQPTISSYVEERTPNPRIRKAA